MSGSTHQQRSSAFEDGRPFAEGVDDGPEWGRAMSPPDYGGYGDDRWRSASGFPSDPRQFAISSDRLTQHRAPAIDSTQSLSDRSDQRARAPPMRYAESWSPPTASGYQTNPHGELSAESGYESMQQELAHWKHQYSTLQQHHTSLQRNHEVLQMTHSRLVIDHSRVL